MESSTNPIKIPENESFQRRTILGLATAVVLLPVGTAFLFAFGRLFSLLNDSFSAKILDCLAIGVGFFWILSLVALLLGLTIIVLKKIE